MQRVLVINAMEHETRVALMEDRTITEFFIERRRGRNIAGNIYKGKVQRVLPGMQAAFIDIGLENAAFLYVHDAISSPCSEFNDIFTCIDESDEESSKNNDTPVINREARIEEIISEGQDILVQVAKAPIGTKGPRLTCHISLPGRFLVFLPTSGNIGISKRIEEEAERNRLKAIVSGLRKNNSGYIVRTASEGVEEEKLTYEMIFLSNLWEKIQKKYKTIPGPALLHQELNIILKAVRDILTHEAHKLIIDSKTAYQSILLFLDEFMPTLKSCVELYEGDEPIFDAYNIEGDISRSLKKKIWLKSGGYIVIEQTEALVAIDVNTGKYVGKHNFEETILKTNLEAVKEIAYQIVLRDIGGIIVIDFIDMEKKAHQDKIFNALKEALKKDRSKTHILPISELGIVQMTRKRTKKSMQSMLCEPCLYCDGEGYLLSKETICYNIYREVIRQSHDMMGKSFTIKVNPSIAELLHGEEKEIINSLERILGKKIVIYPNPQFHLEQIEIIEVLGV
ncbi:MAG: Rne/Rng family ribonuclease [Desulfobacterales bacterium]|nr:Rne/Rng family ribonuclease [Desulfobacterales bacterium]MBF0398618.1 Rne/Rng family ribonuclease [Desulfobacterales bacterium]